MNADIQGSILIIEIEGALDSRTAFDFRSWILEKILQGHREILLNFRDLEYLSSAGISCLLEIQKTIKSQQGKFAITQASPEVEKLLAFFGILREIPLVANVEEFKNLVPKDGESPIQLNESLPKTEASETLSPQEEKPAEKEPLLKETVIPCPNCQSPLRLYRKGKYLCPICHFVFYY